MIKTYPASGLNDLTGFGISRMESIYEKRGGKNDAPHRHDFYTVLLVKSGKGKHLIDFNEYPLNGNQVYFIAPGQVHQLLEEEKSVGYSMVFSEELLIRNNLPATFLSELNLFQDFESSPPLRGIGGELLERLEGYCAEMMEIWSTAEKMKERAIIALIDLFLFRCVNTCTLSREEEPFEIGKNLLRSFKQLVNEHYHEWHQTSAYAEALFITPDHLNKTVKAISGKTAKEHIQSRITVEAKRLLYFSGQTTKEIAHRLGFSEVANFSAFFKKCTGKAPSNFTMRSL